MMIDRKTGGLFYYPCLLRNTRKCAVKKTAKLILCIQHEPQA